MAQASTICAQYSKYKEFVQKLTSKMKKNAKLKSLHNYFLRFQKGNFQRKVIVENYSRFNIEIRISISAEICKLGRYSKEMNYNSSLLNNVQARRTWQK